jgi:hypothetical protein
MPGLDDGIGVTDEQKQAQRHTQAMHRQRRQLPPTDIDGRHQNQRQNRLERKRDKVVGTDPAKTKAIHVRDSADVHAACENERTELTKVIASRFTSAPFRYARVA